MRSVDRLQVQTSSGWMDIGNRLVTITGGSGDAGIVLHMKGHTGAIRIMTTIAKAGECTLKPLGIDMPYEFDQLLGFAINNEPGFWLKNGDVGKDLYVAFTAKSADAVRASYKAAIDAGGTSKKEPSLRPEWRADYFAANIGDPDGYNIEIAYKPWLYK